MTKKVDGMTRQQTQDNAMAKKELRQLQAGDIGAYGKAIGVVPRHLVGGQWNPSKKRRGGY